MFIRKWKFTKEIHKAYRNGFSDGEANMAAYINRDNRKETHPKSFELLLEPYCNNCLEFEADVTMPELSSIRIDGQLHVFQKEPVKIRCKHCKRCESMIETLRKEINNGDQTN